MKLTYKRYAVFALLLMSSMALDVGMDFIQQLPPYRIKRNLVMPFRMLDPIEVMIIVLLAITFFRKPLYVLLAGLLNRLKGSSSGSGGTPSSNQSDQQ